MTAKPDEPEPRNSSLVSGRLTSVLQTPFPVGWGFRGSSHCGVWGVVFEASRGSWTVSWDDDRTQEFALGASSTKTRMQFGCPNFLQHPKTLQFQRCDFNVWHTCRGIACDISEETT